MHNERVYGDTTSTMCHVLGLTCQAKTKRRKSFLQSRRSIYISHSLLSFMFECDQYNALLPLLEQPKKERRIQSRWSSVRKKFHIFSESERLLFFLVSMVFYECQRVIGTVTYVFTNWLKSSVINYSHRMAAVSRCLTGHTEPLINRRPAVFERISTDNQKANFKLTVKSTKASEARLSTLRLDSVL